MKNVGVTILIIVLAIVVGILFTRYKRTKEQLNFELSELALDFNSTKVENKKLKIKVVQDSIKIDSLENIINLKNQKIDDITELVETQTSQVDSIEPDSSYNYLQVQYPDDTSKADYKFTEKQVKEIHKDVIKSINSELIISTYEELHEYYEEQFELYEEQVTTLKLINDNLKIENKRLREISNNFVRKHNKLRLEHERQKFIKNISIGVGIAEAAAIVLILL